MLFGLDGLFAAVSVKIHQSDRLCFDQVAERGLD
jgi:hypothetical protein